MVSVLTSASIDNHVKWLQIEIAAAAEQLHGLEAALHLTAVHQRAALQSTIASTRALIASLEDIVGHYTLLD